MDSNVKVFKNILVTTDFSKAADFAILRAISIAKKFNANITLLHVLQKKDMDNFLDNTLKKLLPKGLWLTTKEYKESLLQEKIQSLLKYYQNIRYVVISKGKPEQKILQYANKNNIDLLILGAHGQYSIRDTFVGTTAEYIIRQTKHPVLIVKNKSILTYKNVFVPVDFSSVSKKALLFALKVFPDSKIHIFHVGDYEYENILREKEYEIKRRKFIDIKKAIFFYLENKMKKFMKGIKKSNKHKHKITLGYPGPTIINEIKKSKQDIVVMGTQGHGKIYYRFIGSVANWVLTEGNVDILLIPPK